MKKERCGTFLGSAVESKVFGSYRTKLSENPVVNIYGVRQHTVSKFTCWNAEESAQLSQTLELAIQRNLVCKSHCLLREPPRCATSGSDHNPQRTPAWDGQQCRWKRCGVFLRYRDVLWTGPIQNGNWCTAGNRQVSALEGKQSRFKRCARWSVPQTQL